MKRKLENSPTFLRLIKNIRGEVQREEQENYFIIPCYFIESGFRTRFNHGLTSSVSFFLFSSLPPLQSQLDPCWVLRVIPNYFASVKRKPCVRSNRLLYGGDKREREADWRTAIFRQQDWADFTLIVKAADASRWLPSLRKSRFPTGGRNMASTNPSR